VLQLVRRRDVAGRAGADRAAGARLRDVGTGQQLQDGLPPADGATLRADGSGGKGRFDDAAHELRRHLRHANLKRFVDITCLGRRNRLA
jgi:hypothetical protein